MDAGAFSSWLLLTESLGAPYIKKRVLLSGQKSESDTGVSVRDDVPKAGPIPAPSFTTIFTCSLAVPDFLLDAGTSASSARRLPELEGGAMAWWMLGAREAIFFDPTVSRLVKHNSLSCS